MMRRYLSKWESAAAVISMSLSSSLSLASSSASGPASGATVTGSPNMKTPLEKGYGS